MNDFILESGEHLANIETQALTLERDPRDSEALNSAFRGFHTIKGLAGFLELWEVQKLAHEVEAVLDRARNGELVLTSRAIDLILASADHLRQWLAHLQAVLQGRADSPPASPEQLLAGIGQLVHPVPSPDVESVAATKIDTEREPDAVQEPEPEAEGESETEPESASESQAVAAQRRGRAQPRPRANRPSRRTPDRRRFQRGATRPCRSR